MNNVVTELLDDKLKVKLDKNDLFDRVINLKLYAGERKANGTAVVKDTYVIRSDWEVYYPSQEKVMSTGALVLGDKGYIRKCRMKPSIKVQYKHISSGTAIEMDIFISNFFMLDSSGQMLMSFNNITYPLLKVEVQMGYWGQFSKQPVSWEDFTTFRPHDGAEVITCEVNYVQTDKLPPDSILHIHGYVGNTFGEPVQPEESSTPTKVQFADLEEEFARNESITLIEDYFYQNITRRFLRSTVYPAKEVPPYTVDIKTGRMDKQSAEKYGVKVYCTKKLKEASDEVEKKGRLKTSKVKGGDSKLEKVFIAGLNTNTTLETLNAVRSVTGLDCAFQILKDGNYVAMLLPELMDAKTLAADIEEALKSDIAMNEVGKALKQDWKNVLPAVYNITTDALCTIVCPFFYFIDPFDVLKFESRYALGGIVSYYANFNASENNFYALWVTVSFATVEDINECQITCTGSKK